MTDIAEPRHRAYLERSLGAHAAYKLHYHLVWSVKRRHRVLVGPVAAALREEIVRAAEALQVTILTLHVEPEHVHLLVSLRPDMAVATVVGRLKGASARHLRQQFPDVWSVDEHSFWNDGYFARTIGDINVAQAKAFWMDKRSTMGTEIRGMMVRSSAIGGLKATARLANDPPRPKGRGFLQACTMGASAIEARGGNRHDS